MTAASPPRPSSRRRSRCRLLRVAWLILPLLISGATPAGAGHELPFYPGYYPQEIRIDSVPLASAAPMLDKSELHAYVGGDPFAGRKDPPNIRSVESLHGYVVLTFNPASSALTSRDARCEAARAIVKTLAPPRDRYLPHPYPVTPYDPDYLEHFDRVQSRKKTFEAATAGARRALTVRAKGPLAEKLVAAGKTAESRWDAMVEEVNLDDLVGLHRVRINGWFGPPWLKQGWFHAYLLQSSAMRDRSSRQVAESLYQRLVTGAYSDAREAVALERSLVGELVRGCERVVVGYTLRRERFSAEFSQGIENVAYDSVGGLNSPIFVRTAKLKDFPWNGWLRLGTSTKAAAAWNPIAGFSDATGGLMWAAVGDPAMLSTPYGGSWVPNRVVPSVSVATGDRLSVPEDALAPDPVTGVFHEIGSGKTARVKITYRVRASAFHDDTRMTAADAIYPYSFASRWSAKRDRSDHEYDPAIVSATALLRRSLVGFKLVKVDSEVKKYSDITFTYVVPVIEVYLDAGAADPDALASIAPPWSAVPWHVMVLMEEAVKRGVGAFSADEAKRRGVRWLDLARDPKLKEAMAPVVDNFARTAYVPEPLKQFVNADEAQARWNALKRFFHQHGHFLVTNGPYRLARWSDGSVTLDVFRDFSNPMGVGSFDRFSPPRRAYAARIVANAERIEVYPEIEQVEKFLRDYRIVREPLRAPRSDADRADVPMCRYVMVDADGGVVAAGSGGETEGDHLVLALKNAPRPGRYTLLLALTLGDNRVNPEVVATEYRVEPRP